MSIFAAVRGFSQGAVFLCEQNGKPVLSFGRSRTRCVRYVMHLRWQEREYLIRSKEHPTCAILLDRGGPEQALRLVLYDGVNLQPIIDYDGKGGGLAGQILIQAHAEQGERDAIIHAIFTSNGESSLVIEPNREFTRHLTLVTAMQEGVNTSGLF